MYNYRPTLKELIDKDIAHQNGYTYVDFIKIASLERRPSYRSVALMFNRNERTIKKWFERFDEEVNYEQETE